MLEASTYLQIHFSRSLTSRDSSLSLKNIIHKISSNWKPKKLFVCLRLSSSDVSGVRLSAAALAGCLLVFVLLLLLWALGEEPRDLFPFRIVSLVSVLITIFFTQYFTLSVLDE